MKTRINKIIYIIVTLVLVASSCEWTPLVWDESKVFVAFSEVSAEIPEEGDNVGIVVAVSALDGAPAVTVDFAFDTTGIEAADAAFAGDQFTLINESQTLSFPNGWGWDTIWIDPTDNEVFTGDKKFNISLVSNSLDLTFGAHDTLQVTLKDNEHPLATWLGTYSVEAISYWSPGEYDESWAVTTTPDPDNTSNLLISINGAVPFIANLDTEAMTITIEPGTDAGDLYGYGPSILNVGEYPDRDEVSPIVGTIESDGTIKIDKLAVYLPDYEYYWDSFNTTWTKTGKKSMSAGFVNPEKASKLK